MHTKRFTTLYIVSTILLCILFVTACGVVKSTQALTDSANNFMTALKDGDYQAAYDLFVPELQSEVGSVENLQAMIVDNLAQPSEWTFSAVNASTADEATTAKVEGSVTYQDGKEGAVTLEFLKSGEEWLLTSFNLTW